MQVVYSKCAGLDVHQKTVVACAMTAKESRGWNKEIKTFGTMTTDLLALSDWLRERECTHIAMESTGEYWRPVFNILSANLEVILVNAHHIKNVPGRKTDIKDAQWIGELLMQRLSSKIGKGNNSLRVGLVQAAHGAKRTKGYLFVLNIAVLPREEEKNVPLLR